MNLVSKNIPFVTLLLLKKVGWNSQRNIDNLEEYFFFNDDVRAQIVGGYEDNARNIGR